ncbi:MAG: hypothetical protein J6A46_01490 [Clostridia bacterium]|nr:hypothetical protein [Clostridia bacterium]
MQELDELKRLELLAACKAAVYGRTLTDVTLSKTMQEISAFHAERAQAVARLLGEEIEIKVGGDDNEA